MSMWEIESLIEESVKLIDNSEFVASEKRNLIWNTYQIQKTYDCSFTQFRVMDILIKNEYVQEYTLESFPLTQKYPQYFKEITQKGFEWISRRPTEEWAEDNDSIAYWHQESNRIFVDFGTEYYTLHPEEKSIEYDVLAFAKLIIKEGGEQNNRSIVYNWTAFAFFHLLPEYTTKSVEELKKEYFTEIHTIFKMFDYSDYEVLHESLDMSCTISSINDNEWLSNEEKEIFKYLVK